MPEKSELIRSILMAFGSFAAAGRKLNIPTATLYFWARHANIPYWRRDAVLQAARRCRIKLTDEQKALLLSKERTPAIPSSSDEQRDYLLSKDRRPKLSTRGAVVPAVEERAEA